MSTINPRIQVMLDNETNGLLGVLAAQRSCSISAVAAELIRNALKIDEDAYFSKVSNQRIEEDNGMRYTHEQAWE